MDAWSHRDVRASGVSRSLEAVCVQEHPRVFRTVLLLVGDREVAREVTQEAVARLVADWAKVSRLESPGGWLHRVAVNLAVDVTRRAETRRRLQDALTGRRQPYASERDVALAVTLQEALRRLPARQRAVLVLRFYEDFPVRDVAAVLGMPEATVKTLTARGLVALRSAGVTWEDGPDE